MVDKYDVIDFLGVGDSSKEVVPGTKVKFVSASDEQVKWGNNDDPRGLLLEGGIYTIDKVEVHSHHTKYYLKEFQGWKFNSVSFEAVD